MQVKPLLGNVQRYTAIVQEIHREKSCRVVDRPPLTQVPVSGEDEGAANCSGSLQFIDAIIPASSCAIDSFWSCLWRSYQAP